MVKYYKNTRGDSRMNNGSENLKQQKAGNPIFILIIFVALIGFLFYVPEIYQKYNSEISKFLGGNKDEEGKDDSKKDGKSPKSGFYQLGSNSTLKFNEITLSNISLGKDELSFTVNTDDTVDFDDLDYYVEFYRERKTFIGRRILHGKVTKSLKMKIDLGNLPIDTTTYMTISYITDDDIQPIESSSDEAGLSTIKCSKYDEVFEYEFYQKKLSKTSYKYTYTNSNLSELSDSLIRAQKKEKTYNEYTGVTAHITENNTSYIFASEFDYSKVSSFQKLNDVRIYDKNTTYSVVKFKMDAEGFDCK